MTCAHIVNVALNKLAGVESADVSLNKAQAKIKLKPGNTISVQQLWQLLREKGYTPKTTIVSVRGDLAELDGGVQLRVSGTNDIMPLAQDPEKAAAWREVMEKLGQRQIVRGTMVPGKDLKMAVPLTVNH
jgi:hypothetical protein